MLPYLPSIKGFVTLRAPHLQVRVQHQALAILLRGIDERDLLSQLPVRQTAATDRVVAGTEWVPVHAQAGVPATPLEREKHRKHRRIAFGGHAAEVVESDVARYAVR